jgi:hypothetical protein
MQTVYTINPPVALDGMVYDVRKSVIEAHVNAQGAAVPAGRFVKRGATPGLFVLPSASGHVTGGDALGFIIHQGMHLNPNGISNDGRSDIQDKESAPIMREGAIWLKCETAFVAGNKPFVRFTVGATPDLAVGRIRNDADTAKAVELQFARFENSGSAGAFALVRFSVRPA